MCHFMDASALDPDREVGATVLLAPTDEPDRTVMMLMAVPADEARYPGARIFDVLEAIQGRSCRYFAVRDIDSEHALSSLTRGRLNEDRMSSVAYNVADAWTGKTTAARAI